jgi:eukaryotic-like serine/threonine-protein kinase
MSLTSGTRLGPYEILSTLGAGGMGEVYRARDPRLNRVIAIKILPKDLSADAERRLRFEREAQSLAALSHPNIVTIHSVEQADGILFLTMEHVDGKPLSELITPGGLPLNQLLALAIPLAGAVSAAHLKGITHRDLKPANVMVTDDGRVKVLDFGLAKLIEAAPAEALVTGLPTVAPSDEGRIVGTVAYMSPEQAEGKRIDARTDIFSLGVLLYEMATGERPFKGDTPVSTITSILRDRPRSITDINHALPRDLALIVRRCLAKDPEHRTQSAKDLRNQLEDLEHALESGELQPPRTITELRTRSSLARRAAFTAGAVLVGVVATWLVVSATPRNVEDSPTITQVARLTHDAGLSEWPTWSPDGNLLAFASNRGGNFDIYVRRIEGGQDVNVTNNASQNFQPAFSPDGNSIAFVSTRASRTGMVKIGGTSAEGSHTHGGDIWLVPALGGLARRVAPDGNFPVWHPNGRKVAYVSGPENHRAILEVALEGGNPQPVLASQSSTWEIVRVRYSPGGAWITFETFDAEILILPAAGGRPRRLVSGFSHVWAPAGNYLYYSMRDRAGGTRLQSVAIDERTGEIAGEPHTLGLMTGTLRDLAISRDGERLALTEDELSFNLTRLPLTVAGNAPAGAEEVLSTGQLHDRSPSVSPDGRRIAYKGDRLGRFELWMLDVETRRMERLQLPGSDLGVEAPRWHPDGRRLLVTRLFPDGKASLWMTAADASDAEELRSFSAFGNAAGEGAPIAPDGRKAVYAATASGQSQLFSLDLSTRQASQLTFSSDDKYSAVWSPDGRWLVYSSNTNGSAQLWRIPAGGGTPEPLTQGDDRVRHMFYSPDGHWLYFQPNHLNIYRMRADGGAVEQVTHFPESALFIEEPTISPDGRYLVYGRMNGGSSLWVLQLGSTQQSTQER